jgi:hypothetical protein
MILVRTEGGLMFSRIQERYHAYRPTKAQALWFGAGCAAATLVAGFGVAGWVTAGAAQSMAEEAAQQTRTEIGVSLCVKEFMAAPDARQRLATLKGTSWYDRDEIVAEGGFATLPNEKAANTAIAMQCATQLAEAPSPTATAAAR